MEVPRTAEASKILEHDNAGYDWRPAPDILGGWSPFGHLAQAEGGFVSFIPNDTKIPVRVYPSSAVFIRARDKSRILPALKKVEVAAKHPNYVGPIPEQAPTEKKEVAKRFDTFVGTLPLDPAERFNWMKAGLVKLDGETVEVELMDAEGRYTRTVNQLRVSLDDFRVYEHPTFNVATVPWMKHFERLQKAQAFQERKIAALERFEFTQTARKGAPTSVVQKKALKAAQSRELREKMRKK